MFEYSDSRCEVARKKLFGFIRHQIKPNNSFKETKFCSFGRYKETFVQFGSGLGRGFKLAFGLVLFFNFSARRWNI